MTRINCRLATCKGLSPDEYIGQFILREGNDILLAVDEEENDIIILDPMSAVFLAHKLLAMVVEIGKERRGRMHTASSDGQEEAVHKDGPSRR